jgi:hypothetical protein
MLDRMLCCAAMNTAKRGSRTPWLAFDERLERASHGIFYNIEGRRARAKWLRKAHHPV